MLTSRLVASPRPPRPLVAAKLTFKKVDSDSASHPIEVYCLISAKLRHYI
ncbi:hypothetical protein BTS2_1069 [Bacillus sp. TS-2]|nr:hypothetical protein BTS2_1069 [Bacillus sp. TS-2]